ncbi:tumor necrosis factor alpha-induced protein 2-like [Polymixia lowei]
MMPAPGRLALIHVPTSNRQQTEEESASVGSEQTDMLPEVPQRSKGTTGKYFHKLKIPNLVRRNRNPKLNSPVAEDNSPVAPCETFLTPVVLDFEENLKQNLLAEASRQLISREEQLFSQEPPGAESNLAPSEEEQDKLQKDIEALLLQVWMAVHNTFSTSSSGENLEVLRSAVITIKEQEAQDQRWKGCPEEQVPEWRPQKCLSTHITLLHAMVDSRLRNAGLENTSGPDGLSTSLKREVCQMGKRLKEDLLTVVRQVKDCYPPEFNILNLYAGLYQQTFSSRLTELARAELDVDDCSYLLSWVNEYYPNDILNHEELDGNIKTASLGALLPLEDLNLLEEQYLTDKQDKVRSWLSTALRQEEERWLTGRNPEVVEQYFFSPLAVDVLQAIDSALTEARLVLSDQRKTQRIKDQLNSFFIRYKKTLEEFIKLKAENSQSVMKANLVCIQQFRVFIERNDLSLPEQLDTSISSLAALEDCGYGYFTCPIHKELKGQYRQVGTPAWLASGGLILDQLLDTLDKHLAHFTDLKPACMEVLLSRLHEEVVVEYVRRMMKRNISMKSREQQECGAKMLCDDEHKINSFFTEGGSGSWLCSLLSRIAELIHLQDPGSLQLEVVTLARDYPDFSGGHVSALLSLKTNLSSEDVRNIKQSLEKNRPSVTSTNHSPAFFSKVRVKWINKFGMRP